MGVSKMNKDNSLQEVPCVEDHISEKLSDDFLRCDRKGQESVEYLVKKAGLTA